MAVSIIEMAIYAIVAYTGILGIVISAFRGNPLKSMEDSSRAMWLIPSIICAYLLASMGVEVTLEDSVVTSTTVNLNSTETWQETVQTSSSFNLENPVWVLLHQLFFVIMLIYVILSVLKMLGWF